VASVRCEVRVAAVADQVWDAVRDVGAVHLRLLPGRVADAVIDGDVRTLTMPDGHLVRELIVDVDDGARRLAYAVVEGSRPPLRHHHATFEVHPDGDAASRLVWTADFLPDDGAELVRARMTYGIAEMGAALAATPPRRP
jgi:Polyketide cyclase / dehydrase and lipid transport